MTFRIILLVSIFLIVLLVVVLISFFWKKSKAKMIPIPETQFIVESGGFELVDENAGAEAVLENISSGSASLFWRPFAASFNNPPLLPGSDYGVIYERDGIHYINDDAFIVDKNTKGKLDNDFIKLVESVVANI